MTETTHTSFEMPDFRSLTPDSVRKEADEAMAERLSAIDDIAGESGEASVDNTLKAFETSGKRLSRILMPAFTMASASGKDEYRALRAEFAPKLAAHSDAIYLNRDLYERFVKLGAQELSEEDRWAVKEHLKKFRQAGADLDADAKSRLMELNSRESEIATRIGDTIIAGMATGAVPLTEAEAAGLDEGTLAASRKAAQADPIAADGAPYLLQLVNYTQQPSLAMLTEPEARTKLFNASVTRGDGHDADTDVRADILELLRVRAERARLLGYPHHAAVVAAQETAGTTDAVMGMLTSMVAPTQRNLDAEAESLQNLKRAAGYDTDLTPADWTFYETRLANESGIDGQALREYFEASSVYENGVFFAANKLYGLSFTPREDIVAWHEDCQAWEVTEEDGSTLGLFILDLYKRPGKSGGAWMNGLVTGNRLDGDLPIICNNLNLTKPADGHPTLLTLDEVHTAFHEFGHALHGLFGSTAWPSTAGTAVTRDFVEFPSQVNEMWVEHRDVLTNYARHWQTGEPMPTEMLDAVVDGAGPGTQATEMFEKLGAMLLDQAWHQLPLESIPDDVAGVVPFETQALKDAGIFSELVPPRYRSTYFNHVFTSGYDAGYYSYLWAEALDADAVDWFRTDGSSEGDGGLNRTAGQRFRETVLSRGNSRDPLESFRELRGRDVDTTALRARYNLI